jgi:small subunit ribosomal protein S6
MLVLMSAELEEPKEEIEKVEEVIRNLGGAVTKVEPWGKKELAYPIQKKTKGIYALFNFDLEPEQTFELRRVLGLRSNIYRQMVILRDE